MIRRRFLASLLGLPFAGMAVALLPSPKKPGWVHLDLRADTSAYLDQLDKMRQQIAKAYLVPSHLMAEEPRGFVLIEDEIIRITGTNPMRFERGRSGPQLLANQFIRPKSGL